MTYARNKALGTYGERIAADHLEALGMVVLARNWTCRFGEIDIVARDGSTLVICEVKTRTSNHHGGPFEAITGHKATRLRRLAMRSATGIEDLLCLKVLCGVSREGAVELMRWSAQSLLQAALSTGLPGARAVHRT